MQTITQELVRKRAEHNDRQIGTLEELSLHQDDLYKLENLQHWCKDLKILYLHGNLISKIENIGKLKKLENLNLSVNNIEKVENLEGCESLKKLDLTLNFVGDIISVESLKKNIMLEDLTLIGNPCTDYDGYRKFVVASLPQLKTLDGEEILPSEKIQALRDIDSIREDIMFQQEEYFIKRRKQIEEKEEILKETLTSEVDDEKLEKFWKSSSEHTPEDRIQLAVMSRKARERNNEKEKEEPKREITFFKENGEPYNINQGRIPFTLKDEFYENKFQLDLHIYKYLDTEYLDVDVQPRYVRVLVKSKIFQLRLDEEVSPDKSSAARSKVTGHLLITMPKAKEVIIPKKKETTQPLPSRDYTDKGTPKREFLEFDEKKYIEISKMLDIVNKSNEDFVDDPEVPPLE